MGKRNIDPPTRKTPPVIAWRARCFPGTQRTDTKEASDNGGPFLLHLSNNNLGNILVDDDWHVTALFDLEWIFAAPSAQLHAPLWLTWQIVDDVAQDSYDDYCASRNVFMDVFRREERKQLGLDKTPLSDAMDASFSSQCTWFYKSISSLATTPHVVAGRLQPLFWPTARKAAATGTTGTQEDAENNPHPSLWPLWQPDAETVAAQKVRDWEKYKADLGLLFQDGETKTG